LEETPALAGHLHRPVDDAGLDERLGEAERLLEESEDGGVRNVHALFVALEAEDFVTIHSQGYVVQNGGAGRADGERRAHLLRRERATSAMRRMCSGPEPQQPPTMLQPTSRSAG